MNDRPIHHARQCSRRLALQALYQYQFTQDSADELIQQYRNDEYWSKSDHDFFSMLVHGCIKEIAKLDAYINGSSEYTVEQIDAIELAALRIATYEILFCEEVPGKVIISEAIRLSKKFGSDEGYTLVNVILDKIYQQVRN